MSETLKVEIVEIVKQFTNDGITYGVYKIKVLGNEEIVVRNDKSIAILQFMFSEPAHKNLYPATTKLVNGFFEALEAIK